MEQRSEKIAAYHEAGHAVVAHALGFTLQLVSLEPDQENSAVLAYCRYDNYALSETLDADGMTEALVAVHLAGVGAEKVLGESILSPHAYDDLKKAEDLLSGVTGGTNAVYLELLCEYMKDTLRLVETHRHKVLAVAEALMVQRQLSGAEAVRLIEA